MESFLRRTDTCIILVFCITNCVNFGVFAVDNFGLFYGSLKTFQAHACDGRELRLDCSLNTTIVINFVRYGRQAGRGDLCPGSGTLEAESCRLDSAIKVIEGKCRGQMICRFLISPDMFDSDPCPGIRKYAEVAYKCRPEFFRNEIICEGEYLNLNCPEGQGIAIYAATFGTTKSGVLECRQPDGLETDDCQASYASEILMRACNGRQHCSLLANTRTFGDLKCFGRKHLKVTYNCIKSDLLKKPAYSTEKSSEETIHTTSFPGWLRAFDSLNSLQRQRNEHVLRTSTIPSIVFRSEMQSDSNEATLDLKKNEIQDEDRKLVGFMSHIMSALKYVSGNKDRLILFVTLPIGVGLVVFVTVIIARYVAIHVQYRRNSKPKIVPISDDQFFSDSDLEQYDPPDSLPPPVINYTASLRRQSSDAQPRAPVTDGSECNHYFS